MNRHISNIDQMLDELLDSVNVPYTMMGMEGNWVYQDKRQKIVDKVINLEANQRAAKFMDDQNEANKREILMLDAEIRRLDQHNADVAKECLRLREAIKFLAGKVSKEDADLAWGYAANGIWRKL